MLSQTRQNRPTELNRFRELTNPKLVIMDTEEGFRLFLTTANFSARVQTTIIDFSCNTLIELAHLPQVELNTSITNMHKALANLARVADRVRLNATRIMLLHVISLHFLDCIKCNALLTAEETVEDVEEMRTHYN